MAMLTPDPLSRSLMSSFDRSHELAVDLMAHSMATYPSEFINLVARRLEQISIEYAVHVRRIIERKGTVLPAIKTPTPYSIVGELPAFELDFKRCLNSIVHSKTLETIFLPKSERIFVNHDNVQVMALKVSTDKFEDVFIPIFGIGYFFFSHVVGQINNLGRQLQ